MTLLKTYLAAAAGALCLFFSACSDTKSYAELLSDETKAVNAFLADQNVYLEIPEDSVFEVGPNAPYYLVDEDNNVYMQVLNPGSDKRVKADAQVFFRFTRYSLTEYAATGELGSGQGNSENMLSGNSSFRYGNYTLSSSSQWGSGLQRPIDFLGYECEVNLVIKSQLGLSSEISQVIPYLYNVRYFEAVSD